MALFITKLFFIIVTNFRSIFILSSIEFVQKNFHQILKWLQVLLTNVLKKNREIISWKKFFLCANSLKIVI